jgi:aspartyl aminopeptidase
MTTTDRLLSFLSLCPTPFQFADYARSLLLSHGYTEFQNSASLPRKGFVIRHNRSLIAFNNGGTDRALIIGTHCDSPVLRIDPSNETVTSGYGGGLWYSYLNRDLRVAGSVVCRDGDDLISVPFDSGEPIAVVNYPKLPEGSVQLDLSQFSLSFGGGSLKDFLREKIGKEVVSWELSCVDGEGPVVVGLNGEFVASPRLDNQASTFSGLEAFVATEPNGWLNVLAVFDHEEVGSLTLEGARGMWVKEVLETIIGEEKFGEVMARSFAVSCDSAQAFHPNFPEKYDKEHAPVLGGGVALKRSPGYLYATDLASSLPIEKACKKLGIKLQVMMNRNDIAGGSTIGPAIALRLGVATVDLGQPLLAMHSIKELIAVKDVDDTTALFTELFAHFDEYRIL